MDNQKVALVTGGSSGIGKDIAIRLAKDGFKVCINYSRLTEKAEEVKKIITDNGGVAIICKADVTDESAVKEMLGRIKDEFKQLDVLVNNAGIEIEGYIEDFDISDWKRVLDVNLVGKMICIKQAVPMLKRSKCPRIINIASRMGTKPIEEISAYCCSQAGTIMLTKSAGLELAKYGIKINTVSPGLTRTPMVEPICTEDSFINYAKRNPSGRVGRGDDIANAVSFLVSEEAEFINGENINVSGGILLK